LSEQSERVPQALMAVSIAGDRGASPDAEPGRRFFGYFLVAADKKVPRLSGRDRAVLIDRSRCAAKAAIDDWIPAFAGMTIYLFFAIVTTFVRMTKLSDEWAAAAGVPYAA
jgi:hypothetical protein